MTGVYRASVASNRRKALMRVKECDRAIPKDRTTPYAREILALQELHRQVFAIWNTAPEEPVVAPSPVEEAMAVVEAPVGSEAR